MNPKDLIAEIEFEATSTRRLLERIPAEKLAWAPHDKAMPLGQLAFHVATIPGNNLSFANDGRTNVEVLTAHHIPASKNEILENFETSLAGALQLLGRISDDWGAQKWDLIKNDHSIFSISRSLFSRLLVLNHFYHHRGELVSYLRILDVPIPSVYGPSADEDPFA
ncbi:DinB family protein [Mucilaginibacter ginsenosidivorans]|uniref:DinB family protein n=1 Tax=Mucilaginibacter ginsenosidivorans TaxID=398053 RepID=A0A5B8UXL2_9SPHI|nr:DinB family protein [Mucilaginibacter ginsenosidivorans]QEC63689.1 DinB family protein [Mucilaginibacter ginsenosidivorans]